MQNAQTWLKKFGKKFEICQCISSYWNSSINTKNVADTNNIRCLRIETSIGSKETRSHSYLHFLVEEGGSKQFGLLSIRKGTIVIEFHYK